MSVFDTGYQESPSRQKKPVMLRGNEASWPMEEYKIPSTTTSRLTDVLRREAGLAQKKDGIIVEILEEVFQRLEKLEQKT